MKLGLSPLARGTGFKRKLANLATRFIPARAGNRRPVLVKWRNNPVYPRSRGEQLWMFLELFKFFGLSPLARGTVDDTPAPYEQSRFIPARAGNRSTNT